MSRKVPEIVCLLSLLWSDLVIFYSSFPFFPPCLLALRLNACVIFLSSFSFLPDSLRCWRIYSEKPDWYVPGLDLLSMIFGFGSMKAGANDICAHIPIQSHIS